MIGQAFAEVALGAAAYVLLALVALGFGRWWDRRVFERSLSVEHRRALDELRRR